MTPCNVIFSHEKKQRERAAKALANARQRCTNPKNKDYANYGAKGIQVLLSLDELVAAIGLPDPGLTLDRINPNGHYEPGNVRWATKAVQAANKKGSPGGSTPPLHTLIAQQKLISQQQEIRPRVTEAWRLVLKAFNRGKLSASESVLLSENLGIAGPANEIFGSREVVVGGETQMTFRLPSLTLPTGLVEARGPSRAAPNDELADFYLHHGLLFRLRDVEGAANIPSHVRKALTEMLSTPDCPGLALVGRPTDSDLRGGWFEVWMLAAASRLPQFGRSAALFPAMTCLELLNEFGGSHAWDENCHPLLDASLLFIPDLQLDCGPWGYLSNYQLGAMERLLRYRSEAGHKTVVGVQAPHNLPSGLQNLLLANFNVHNVPSGTSSHSVPTVAGTAFSFAAMPSASGS